MLVLETVAFGGAGVADRRTDSANLLGELAVSRHVLRCQGANVGTVPQQRKAMGAGLDIRFLKTGLKAFFTDLHTSVASIDALLIFGHVGLDNSWQSFPSLPGLQIKFLPDMVSLCIGTMKKQAG